MYSLRSPHRRLIRRTAAIGLLSASLATAEASVRPGDVQAPHATLPCLACHVDGTESTDVSCTTAQCHAATAAAFLASLHEGPLRRRDDVHHLACQECHEGHRTSSGQATRRALRSSALQQRCIVCHVDTANHGPALPGADGSVDPGDERPSCFDCHGHHRVLDRTDDATSPTDRSKIAAACGRCHPHQAERYALGAHGRALAAGDTLAPSCVSCHDAHSPAVPGPGDRVETCGSCHDDPVVLRRTGLTRPPLVSFRATFHGLAHAHGITDIATCVSCHGAHAVLPSSDRRSSISPQQVAKTCSNCHPQATPKMLQAVTRAGALQRLEAALHFLDALLPVARTRINLLGLTGLGAATGFLSGLFGVSGGLLMTPLLLLIGIPAVVAVSSDTAQIAATAVAGSRDHARRGNVDWRLAILLAAGGVVGGSLGVQFVRVLEAAGTFDPLLRVGFVVLLSAVGVGMFRKSLNALRGRPIQAHHPALAAVLDDRLPLRLAFPTSGTQASALLPVAVGFVVGLLSALFGIAGGFLLLPALVHWLGVPTRFAVGTSLVGVAVTSSNVAFQQAAVNHAVDLLLALTVFLGAVVGSRLGLLAARRLRRDRIQLFLAVAVLALAIVLLFGLARSPDALLTVGAMS